MPDTLANVLGEAFDPWRFPASNLRVDLRDIEDVDVHFLSEPRQECVARGNARFVIVPGDDRGRLGCKLSDPGKDALRGVRGKVGNQLVVVVRFGARTKK